MHAFGRSENVLTMVSLVTCDETAGANLAIGFLVGLMTGRPAVRRTVLHRRPPVDTTRAIFGLGRPVPNGDAATEDV